MLIPLNNISNKTTMPFSLDNHNNRVTNAATPEELRDIVVRIFREMAIRRAGYEDEITGFGEATDYELHLALYRTVNEMVMRMCH